jgi:hypothetical protein
MHTASKLHVQFPLFTNLRLLRSCRSSSSSSSGTEIGTTMPLQRPPRRRRHPIHLCVNACTKATTPYRANPNKPTQRNKHNDIDDQLTNIERPQRPLLLWIGGGPLALHRIPGERERPLFTLRNL